ncbi:unnamed protein product [Durusdinium trenchii]
MLMDPFRPLQRSGLELLDKNPCLQQSCPKLRCLVPQRKWPSLLSSRRRASPYSHWLPSRARECWEIQEAVYELSQFNLTEKDAQDNSITLVLMWSCGNTPSLSLLSEVPFRRAAFSKNEKSILGNIVCNSVATADAALAALQKLGPLVRLEAYGHREDLAKLAVIGEPKASLWSTLHGAFYVPAGYNKLLRRRSLYSEEDDPSPTRAFLRQHSEFGSGTESRPVERRAITLQQLMDVETEARMLWGEKYEDNVTLHDINTAIIQPACAKHGVPYALTVNKEPGLHATIFVTHAWQENFHEFVESIKDAIHNPKSVDLRLCGVSNHGQDAGVRAAGGRSTPCTLHPCVATCGALSGSSKPDH